MTYKEEAHQLREALVNLVMMVSNYIDPDEPNEEWIDGVHKTLGEANNILRKTKC
jgi:hypothetical protein